MPPLKAEDLEDLDNLDPDDFDESMDTAEARGDVVDPNAENDDEANDATEDDETVAESGDADDVVESSEDDESDSGESDDDDSAGVDDDSGDSSEEVDDAEEDTEEDTAADTKTETEEDAEGSDDAVSDDPRIPKSRFDSVNARRKEAERKLAELQTQINKTGETGQRADRVAEIQTELGEIDDQINDAILDADAAKLKELRAKERELNNEALDFRLKNATNQAAEEAKFDALIDKVETDYPEYNPDSDNFNEEMVSETLRLQKALIASGSPKGDALLEAVDLIRPRYVTEEPGAAGKTSLRDTAPPKRDTKTNTKRNKKAAKSQPANTASRTSKLESTEDIDFDNIQQPEDIDKFDEKTLARLSGDYVD